MHKYRVWKAAIRLTEYIKNETSFKTQTKKWKKKKKNKEKSLKNYKEGWANLVSVAGTKKQSRLLPMRKTIRFQQTNQKVMIMIADAADRGWPALG